MAVAPPYIVVFDIAKEPFLAWLVPGAIGGAFLVLGAGVFVLSETRRTKVLALLGLCVALAWLVLSQTSLWIEYNELTEAAREGRYEVVEGRVEEFLPDPPAGNGAQSFAVGGRRFEIWSATATSAYHQTVGSGGLDLSRRCVRMHVATSEKIIWLGVMRQCDEQS